MNAGNTDVVAKILHKLKEKTNELRDDDNILEIGLDKLILKKMNWMRERKMKIKILVKVLMF